MFDRCEGVELLLHVYLALLAESLLNPASSNWSVLSNKHFVTVSSLRSSLCWDVTQNRLVVIYRRFGTHCHFYFQRSSFPDTSVTTKLLCALSQKIADQERKHNISSCYFVWWRKPNCSRVVGTFVSYTEGHRFDSRPRVFYIITESFLRFSQSE